MSKYKNIIVIGACVSSEIVRKSLHSNDNVLLVEAKENDAFKPEPIPFVLNTPIKYHADYVPINPKSNFIDRKTLNKLKQYKTNKTHSGKRMK